MGFNKNINKKAKKGVSFQYFLLVEEVYKYQNNLT